jgi:hypothetical protein
MNEIPFFTRMSVGIKLNTFLDSNHSTRPVLNITSNTDPIIQCAAKGPELSQLFRSFVFILPSCWSKF